MTLTAPWHSSLSDDVHCQGKGGRQVNFFSFGFFISSDEAVDEIETERYESPFQYWQQRDPGVWLQDVRSYMQEKDVDETENPEPETEPEVIQNTCHELIQNTCRANETCASFSECLAEEKCCRVLKRESEVNEDEDGGSGSGSGSGNAQEQENPGALFECFVCDGSALSDWLLLASEPASPNPCEFTPAQIFPEFNKGLVARMWLCDHGGSGDFTRESFSANHVADIRTSPLSTWLSNSSDAYIKTELDPSCFEYLGHAEKEWLSPSGTCGGVEECLPCDSVVQTLSDSFSEVTKTSIESWLLKSEENYADVDVGGKMSRSESNSVFSDDESVWLLKKEGSSEKLSKENDYDCMFACFQQKGFDVSQWVQN